MREDQIYIYSKKWFSFNNYKILAGQPPSGSDNIPNIEIKDPKYNYKGSKGAYKPDLIVANNNYIIIIECKPLYDEKDMRKLLDIEQSSQRKINFYKEIISRGLLKKNNLSSCFDTQLKFNKCLRYALANTGKYKLMDKIINLSVKEKIEDIELVNPKFENYQII